MTKSWIQENAAKKAMPPFRVLGIALVVDQIGKGAQMVLRYPVSLGEKAVDATNNNNSSNSNNTNNNTNNNNKNSNSSSSHNNNVVGDHELFFQMPPRVIAKLFRPKKSLCGQPMTLSVGGTVFCCRAVLFEHNDDVSDNASTTSSVSITATSATTAAANHENKLVLFSVIVALTPSEPTKSIPISGWFEGEEDYSAGTTTTTPTTNNNHHGHGHRAASPSVLSIRRVHLSLARLCRALEREERRCRFVSAQSTCFFRIRSDINKQWEERMMTLTTSGGAANNNNNNKGEPSSMPPPPNSTSTGTGVSPKNVVSGNISSSGSTSSTPDVGHHRVPRHTRNHTAGSISTTATLASFSLTAAAVSAAAGGGGDGTDQHPTNPLEHHHHRMSENSLQYQMEKEKEQEILEHVLASSPPAEHAKQHCGNLAREMVQVFHALSRDDPRHKFEVTHTPGMLSGRDSIVYVNGHVAVPIESAIGMRTMDGVDRLGISNQLPFVRSYHTVLFPKLSPMDLVDALQLAASSSPQQLGMQQFLFMANPARSLSEIALEANVPLSAVLEMASQLIHQGVCIASPVISRSTRLACAQGSVTIMQELALEFGQTFALGRGGSIFFVVSFLTFRGCTLGEALSAVSNGESEEALLLQCQLQHFLRSRLPQQHHQHHQPQQQQQHARRPLTPTAEDAHHHHLNGYADLLPAESAAALAARHHADELEEVLFSMAVWLVSRRVLVKLDEYLVAVDTTISNWQDEGGSSSSVELRLAETDSGDEKRTMSAASTSTFLPPYFGTIPDSMVDENLFKELKEASCLDGTKSLIACAWKLGVEAHRLRSWAMRHDNVRIVERIPAPGNDWGFVH